MDNLLSVIVPVYNAEKHLSRCIESILNQEYRNIELVLVNDGSKDASGEICDKYAEADNRILVIHKENGGVSEARNTALERASGEYVMFIDSDDEIEQGFLSSAMSHIQDVDLYISGIKMIYTDPNGEIKETEYKINATNKMSVSEMLSEVDVSFPPICVCGPCCKIYKASTIREYGLRFDKSLSLGEDTMFNLSYFEHINSVYFDEKSYYLYHRENENSLFSKYREDIYEINEKVYDEWRRVVNKLALDSEGLARFENMYLDMMIGCIHHVYRNTKDKKARTTVVKRVLNNKWVQKNRNYIDTGLSRIVKFAVTRGCTLLVRALFAVRY